jgi:hypothetical protein
MLSMYLILPAALCSGVYSASNRKEYQKQKGKISQEWSTAGMYISCSFYDTTDRM